LSGIPTNLNSTHGIHIHQYGDLTSTDGTATGGHYVGGGSNSHACFPNATRHEGDTGN